MANTIQVTSNLVEDCPKGFREIPDGTKRRIFKIRYEKANVTIYATVFFLPNGQRLFRFINDQTLRLINDPTAENQFAFSSTEVSVIHSFIEFLSANKDKLYPTADHPAGMDISDIVQDVNHPM